MGSGKTERLIELADQVPDNRKLILAYGFRVVNPSYADCIISRNGRKIFCNVSLEQRSLAKIPKELESIFIDEGQWASPDCILNCEHLSKNGHDVYVSLLNCRYTGEYYWAYRRWLQFADSVDTLMSVCAVTGGKAEYSELLTDKESVRKEDYRAVCWEVFRQSKHCRI